MPERRLFRGETDASGGDRKSGSILEAWLGEKRGHKVHIRIPKKGKKEKLVELAAKNAKMVLAKDKERIKREEGRTIGAVKEIEELLGP